MPALDKFLKSHRRALQSPNLQLHEIYENTASIPLTRYRVSTLRPSDTYRLISIRKQLWHHPDAATGYCQLVRQRRFHTSSPMDQKIPADFVDALKNSCVWKQDWGFVVYRTAFSDGDAWERFKETFSNVSHQSFDRLAAIYSNTDDVRIAQKFWRCRFIDEPGLKGKDPAAIKE